MPENQTVYVGSERDANRIEQLRRAETEIRDQDQGLLATEVLIETVALWRDFLSTTARFVGPNLPSDRSFSEAAMTAVIHEFDQNEIDRIIAAFRQVDTTDQSEMHDAALGALLSLEGVLTRGTTSKTLRFLNEDRSTVDARGHITSWRSRAALLQEGLRTLRVLDGLRERSAPVLQSAADARVEAADAGKELDELRAALAEARAERAQGELSGQFQALADRERKTSWGLRAAAYLLVAIAAGVAIAAPQASEWSGVVGSLALASILGGASAYTARLASVHRHTGDWANAVRVQLDTFQDFLGAIDNDEARIRVYEEFGRRVLGAPPVPGSDEGNAMPAAQLVELANVIAAARRS